MRRHHVLSLTLLLGLSALAGEAAKPAGDWWNPAWAARKRVRVRLPAVEHLGFAWHPPNDPGEDTVAAEAAVATEKPLEAGAQAEIRVVDAGGNVLPAVVSGPDTRGLVHVTFPARRSIPGALAGGIQDGTETVELGIGRDKAVTPGLRFHVLGGHDIVATLEVQSVADKTSTAKVLNKTVPQIAAGTPVRSVTLTGAEYFIYYGNPKPEGESATWTPPTAPVRRYTWTITAGSVPTTAEVLRHQMRGNVSFAGGDSLDQISTTANPNGPGGEESWAIAAYESHVYCELPGLYRFALDTTGPSFLFLDGRFTAARQGFFHQTGQLEHRGKIELSAGYHLLTMFVGERAAYRATRLGWQPVTEKVYNPVPASFYVTRVTAEAVALERRDEGRQVFFSYSLAPRALLVGGKKRYQFVQFHNHTPVGEGDDVTWQWEFPDGEQDRDRSPGRQFEMPEGSTAAHFPVVLRASAGGKPLGEYQRVVYCDEREAQPLRLSLDIVSFANIVYDDESTSIAARLRNANLSSVALRSVGKLRQGDASEIILRRPVLIPAEDEDFCILPIDMKQLEPKRALIDLELFLATERVLDTSMRIIPSPEGLTTLRRGLGALFDEEDRRVMICAETEDRDRHLRWVFYNYVRDDLLPRKRNTRTRCLLFGDRMANPVAPDQSFNDYVTLLTQRLQADGRTLQVVARNTGLLPTLADLILFAKTLDAAKPFPEIIILSPGLADVAQACGERDFARSMDVMIDAIRAKAPRTKIIIVSPPPYPGNPRLSKHYTEALATLAREHHLAFLDLGRLLTKDEDDWVKAWYAAPDADGIFLANPNEAAHQRIADALHELIY